MGVFEELDANYRYCERKYEIAEAKREKAHGNFVEVETTYKAVRAEVLCEGGNLSLVPVDTQIRYCKARTRYKAAWADNEAAFDNGRASFMELYDAAEKLGEYRRRTPSRQR